jgi:hypothetical protein
MRSHLLSQAFGDLPGELGDIRLVQMPWALQSDVVGRNDLRRTARQNVDPVTKTDGFSDVVCNEKNGEAGLQPKPLELVVQ